MKIIVLAIALMSAPTFAYAGRSTLSTTYGYRLFLPA